MAYRYRRPSSRRRTYRGRGRRSNYRAGGYTRRRTYRRTGRRRSVGTQKIVIQVIGGQGGVPVSATTLGGKSSRPVRSRY